MRRDHAQEICAIGDVGADLGMMTAGVTVPIEALATLRRRLAALPGRHPQREALLSSTTELYAISRATLYRLLRGERGPRDAHRADRGTPRVMPAAEIERWCEIIAAMKPHHQPEGLPSLNCPHSPTSG
jgi:hypothetical protein